MTLLKPYVSFAQSQSHVFVIVQIHSIYKTVVNKSLDHYFWQDSSNGHFTMPLGHGKGFLIGSEAMQLAGTLGHMTLTT